jgi:hypothetical protein
MAKDAKKGKGRKSLLEAAREHHDALQAAGLSTAVIDKYENALNKKGAAPNVAAQTNAKELSKAIDEVQAAIRKEFPGNASFQSVFKANEPLPSNPREILGLGRLVAKEMPDYSQNLIKYAINAASAKHLSSLADQLEHELGGADPAAEIPQLEEQIREAGRRAFEGKPEASAFER